MKNKVLTLLTASLLFTSTVAQQAYEPTQENLKTRKEFQDDKFGIFIHYGIYSMLGDGEARFWLAPASTIWNDT